MIARAIGTLLGWGMRIKFGAKHACSIPVHAPKSNCRFGCPRMKSGPFLLNPTTAIAVYTEADSPNNSSASAVATDQGNDSYDRLVAKILATVLEKGERPAARWRRKATGLQREVAGLPEGGMVCTSRLVLTRRVSEASRMLSGGDNAPEHEFMRNGGAHERHKQRTG